MQIAAGMGSPRHLSHLAYSQGLPVSTLHDGLMHNRELPGARFGGNGCAGFRSEARGRLARPMRHYRVNRRSFQ
jgi:hypothetical protein